MFIIILLSVLTALILIGGVLIMARGGQMNNKYSTKLMSLRVFLQSAAIIALLIFYFYNK